MLRVNFERCPFFKEFLAVLEVFLNCFGRVEAFSKSEATLKEKLSSKIDNPTRFNFIQNVCFQFGNIQF